MWAEEHGLLRNEYGLLRIRLKLYAAIICGQMNMGC